MGFLRQTSCYICKEDFDFSSQYYADKFEPIINKMGLRRERIVKGDIHKDEFKSFSMLHLHHEHFSSSPETNGVFRGFAHMNCK